MSYDNYIMTLVNIQDIVLKTNNNFLQNTQKRLFSPGVDFEEHCLTSARGDRGKVNWPVPFLIQCYAEADPIGTAVTVPFKDADTAFAVSSAEITGFFQFGGPAAVDHTPPHPLSGGAAELPEIDKG